MWRTVTVLGLICGFQSHLPAQSFRPRGQGATSQVSPTSPARIQSSVGKAVRVSQEEPAKGSAVSQDLLQLYSSTTTAQSENDFTKIASAAAKVLPEKARSNADREYAASLLAWALNRRGELRSSQAAQAVQAGRVTQAQEMDAKSVEDFANAVEYAPGNWRHRHNYAIALAMQGDYTLAIGQLGQVTEINPEYANGWFNRAELYFEIGKFDLAEQDYSRAIDLTKDAQYYNCRAHCRFMQENFQAALDDYRQAVQLQQENSAYLCDMADAYQYMGLWQEAAKAYRTVVAVDNTFARAYQNAAWLMSTCPDESVRNHHLALTAAQKSLELTGDRTPGAIETIAAATAAIGKIDEAIKLQQEAVQLAVKLKMDDQQIAEFKQRLARYQSGQTYLQPDPKRNHAVQTRTAARP